MNIIDVLTQFVSTELLSGRQRIGPDDNLLDDGMVDSVGMLRLVAYIEERFAVQVPPDKFTVENFRNLRVVAAWLGGAMRSGESGTHDG